MPEIDQHTEILEDCGAGNQFCSDAFTGELSMNPASCTDCGIQLAPTDAGPPESRRPCPNCGSDARTVSISGSATLTLSVTGTLSGCYYSDTLISAAEGLLDSGHYGIATVVVHMACEVETERALSAAFQKQGMSQIEDAVEALLSGYNLGNDRIRNLFVALTGKEVHKEHFWPDFCASATRRNKAVHKGSLVTEPEARSSLAAGKSLLAYLR